MTNKSNELAIKTKTDVAVADIDIADFMGAGDGFENISQGDIIIPRLVLLQSLSPQLKKTNPLYIEDASYGDILLSGIGKVFKEGVHVIPVHFEKVWLEWSSDDKLVKIHTDAGITKYAKNFDGKNILESGNQIVENYQLYCVNLSYDGRFSLISAKTTQIKKIRQLLTLATDEQVKMPDGSTRTPPLFYRSYFLTVVEESNAKGEWNNWKIERGPTLQEIPDARNILARIKEFRSNITSDLVSANAYADNADQGRTEEVPF